jgi:hypothetical protein
VLRHPARRLPWIDARCDLPRQPRPHPAPGDRPSSGRLPRDPRRVGHLRRIMRRCRVSRLTGAGTVSGAGARPRGRRDQPSDHGLRPYRLATLHTRRDEKFYLGPDGKLFTVTDRVKLEDFVGPRPSALKAAGAAGSRVLKPMLRAGRERVGSPDAERSQCSARRCHGSTPDAIYPGSLGHTRRSGTCGI